MFPLPASWKLNSFTHPIAHPSSQHLLRVPLVPGPRAPVSHLADISGAPRGEAGLAPACKVLTVEGGTQSVTAQATSMMGLGEPSGRPNPAAAERLPEQRGTCPKP